MYYELAEPSVVENGGIRRNTLGLALRDLDEAGKGAQDYPDATRRIDDIKQYMRYIHLNWEWDRVNALAPAGVSTPAKEKAWHGWGQIGEDYPTSAEAIKLANLDYTVEKRKLFIYDNENQLADEEREIKIAEIEVPNYYATMRTDTEEILGVVGKDYEVVQNTEAFNFFDAIVQGEGIPYETAGALGKGESSFINDTLTGYIKEGSDELREKYLFLTT